MKPDASEQALKAAKQFVTFCEEFRKCGSAEFERKYPGCGYDGYDAIVRRARSLLALIDSFDGRAHTREPITVTVKQAP